MIGHFPIPYPDELFCSICARLNDHMRYPSIRGLREDLFGGKGVNRKAYLPSRLDHLVSMLPPGYRLSADDIIDKHTILPFYSPFLPADRINTIRMGMHTDKGQHTKRIGDTFHLPVFVRHLRYCPLCVEEERTKSECYWHRIHNVPGVEVCPMHCTWLEESDTDISRFVSADQAVRPGPARHLDRSNPYHASLLKIAQDALWLFNQGKPGADLRVIRWHYRFLLYKRELATYKGVIQADALLQSFASYFPAELLKHLNCEVNTARCWITRLVTASASTMHPIQYLLLMHFLGYTAEGFFAILEDAMPFGEGEKAFLENAPFGEGPWLCLNPVSDHYLQREVQSCHVTYRGIEGNPWKGTFTCHCGFIYERLGPDSSEDDLLRNAKVKSYGHLWEAALRQMWMDSSISHTQMASKLRVARKTVKVYAVRLGLPFPRFGGTSTKPDRLSVAQTSLIYEEKVERYRKAWLSLLQDNPEDGVRLLERKSPGVCSWLFRHDREWLNQNRPLRKLSKKPKTRIDWESRDQRLAEEVKTSAKYLKTISGAPVVLSRAAIARNIGADSLFRWALDKLPLTSSAIADVAETREDFAIRRIHWTANCYRQEGICPSLRQFILRAGVREIAGLPQIREAAIAALESLSL